MLKILRYILLDNSWFVVRFKSQVTDFRYYRTKTVVSLLLLSKIFPTLFIDSKGALSNDLFQKTVAVPIVWKHTAGTPWSSKQYGNIK